MTRDRESRPFSRDVLKKMVRHVGWEVAQMLAVARRLPEATDWRWEMAAFEDVLLHARGILEFLVDKNAHPRQVIARDYNPDWVMDPAVAVRFCNTLQLLHQHLAHVCLDREGWPEAWWGPLSIAYDTFAVIEEFVRTLDDEFEHLFNEFLDKTDDVKTTGGRVESPRINGEAVRRILVRHPAPEPYEGSGLYKDALVYKYHDEIPRRWRSAD